MDAIARQLAEELGVDSARISAAVRLLDDGATVPFIARYRKEATGALDDTQLRRMEERLRYLRELAARRETIRESIEQQGKLDADLSARLDAATTKTELEDLYLPYRPRRRTKGQIAREAGLEPLADGLLNDPSRNPEEVAADYVNIDQGVADAAAALQGARAILMERFAEDADLLGTLRAFLQSHGVVVSSLVPDKGESGQKFADYFDYREAWSRIPSHRALALFRGRNEGVLQLSLVPDPDRYEPEHGAGLLTEQLGLPVGEQGAGPWFREVARWTWRVKILPHLETELFNTLRERAEDAAIQVFGKNLKDLLLAPPAGRRVTMGLDPAYRTGVKVVVLDETGKLLAHDVIYPHVPQRRWAESKQTLLTLVNRFRVSLIAIGNGTASRETDELARELVREAGVSGLQSMMVSEAGASVYSASEEAAREFPELDVSYRGAVSIARRLQDPLAELVKIDPKAIGVGQYQHDVSQTALARSLDAVVEDCVNGVGVDLNTASAPLLARVSGLSRGLADSLVAFRNTEGAFRNRQQLLKVPRLGARTYEQCAGFLRIREGDNPLDASAVHPEAYSFVEQIAGRLGVPVSGLLGNGEKLSGLKPEALATDAFGVLTVRDVLTELAKPGRDPRPEFRTVSFREDVTDVKDLRPGMVLDGVVTNVTNFGAFVDVGVHQDGLVHISALSHKFVKDPAAVVKAGDFVTVKVMSVDVARKRIGLSMRLDDDPEAERTGKTSRTRDKSGGSGRRRSEKSEAAPARTGAMAEKLQAALDRSRR